MSQEKVDKYKEEKKNRKARLEKEKRRQKFWKFFGPVLAIAIVAVIGLGIYFIPELTNKAKQNAASSSSEEIDIDALTEMINASLSANDTAVDTTEGEAVDDASGSEAPADSTVAE